MSTLKEHISHQNQPSSVFSLEALSPKRKTTKINVSGRAAAIFGISLVVVLAVVSTIAFIAPGSQQKPDNEVLESQKQDIHPQVIANINDLKPRLPEPEKVVVQAPRSENLTWSGDKKNEKDIGRGSSTRNGTTVCETSACAIAGAQIIEAIDFSTNPCDNFYQFACGGWINKHPIPEDGRDAVYDEVYFTVDKRLELILESGPPANAPLPLNMTRTFYDACNDTDTLEVAGLFPLISVMEINGDWPMITENWDPANFDLQQSLVRLRDLNANPLLAVGVDTNVLNTTQNIIYLDAGTLPLSVGIMGNPSDTVLNAYRTYMHDTAKEMKDQISPGLPDSVIAPQVEEVIQFEMAFSQIVINAAEHNTDPTWLTTISGIQSDTDDGTVGVFDWLAFMQLIFADTGVLIQDSEPVLSFKSPFFADFSNFLAATDTRIVANAILWWWVYELSTETTSRMREIAYNFNEDLTGAQAPDRSAVCTRMTNLDLGFAVSRDYVDRYFSPAAKQEVSEMVTDMRVAFDSLMNENTWMLPDDLVVAKEKLAAIDAFVAYPDWILNDTELTLGYEGLDIVEKQHFSNLLRVGKWYDKNSLATLRETPVHSFNIPPTVVNAFYSAVENSITILVGMLQNPYFAHGSLAAVNYAAIGFFIGHEMTHGFDNIGRLYDKDGNLVQWWSDETIAAYNERAQCFIDQYDNYFPPELPEIGLNISVGGRRTEPENIADNGGIRVAARAYELYVDRYGQEPGLPGLDEFSLKQIFYLGFSYPWCVHESPEVVLEHLVLDPHAPDRFRVLGPLSNDEEFSKVWNCPAGSPMNRGENRCLLW
ncbi:hypothetical protein SK128_024308 [Halocaridina rubra]|uniref:Uncharacterized protein n=1 Tax=Halocaridina rubra TaxID=373956 RepID=A0AAN8WTL5_HALRR